MLREIPPFPGAPPPAPRRQPQYSYDCHDQGGNHDDSSRPPSSSDLRLVVIADTHEQHRSFTHNGERDLLPPGDVLIHCGDILRASINDGGDAVLDKLRDFNRWLGYLKPRYPSGILVIPGNHDNGLQKLGCARVQQELTNATWLVQRTVIIRGMSFFGCPISYGTSSNRGYQDFPKGQEPFRFLPSYVDVLITHGSYCDGKLAANYLAPSPHSVAGVRCRLHLAGHDHQLYGARIYDVDPHARVKLPSSVAELMELNDQDPAAVWRDLPPPHVPLPQIANIGLLPGCGVPDLNRDGFGVLPTTADGRRLTDGSPWQPELLAHLMERYRTTPVPAAAAAAGDDRPSNRHDDDVKSVVAHTGAAGKERQSQLRRSIVTVVASNLNLKYRPEYRPVEIDIVAAPLLSVSGAEGCEADAVLRKYVAMVKRHPPRNIVDPPGNKGANAAAGLSGAADGVPTSLPTADRHMPSWALEARVALRELLMQQSTSSTPQVPGQAP